MGRGGDEAKDLDIFQRNSKFGEFPIKYFATDQTEHTLITTKMTRSEPSSTVNFLSHLGSSWATGTGVIFSKFGDFGGIFIIILGRI